MMKVVKRKSLFVAATGQNVGKTTTCLGLVSGFQKRHPSVGFIKPVGQESLESDSGVHVDKDVILFKSQFSLQDEDETMSPVLFPKGFTRDFLDGKVSKNELIEKIELSFNSISEKHPITVVEGTGHTGVGSIVDLNNAQVASLLKSPVILVASAGLGSSFDELTLNYLACEKYGAKVIGVILNRVLPNKEEMILNYIPKALKRWNLPLLGSIPYSPFLNSPTMSDFEILFQTRLLNGKEHSYRHFQNIRLVAGSSEMYQKRMGPSQLIITPSGREDIVLATLSLYWDLKNKDPKADIQLGIILTGKTPPKKSLIEEIIKTDIPTLYAPVSSFIAMKMINSYTGKYRKEDHLKIEEALRVVESHIDFEKIEKALE